MGLLDDAIREHLELKRRRGGDAAEIAREEQAALDPEVSVALGEVEDPEDFEEEPDEVPEGPYEAAEEPDEMPFEAALEDHPADEQDRAPDDRRLADFSSASQDTAELDMSAVLDGDEKALHGSGDEDPGLELPPDPPSEAVPFEWDDRDEEGEEELYEDVPGQDRLSFE
ncbi:MAG TPA: hypothetical protein VKG62_09010 [Solirubrobacteraceae bacterium]|nr:hypothetical protein [Solirubrobacteraceae bacterium]